MKKVLVVGVGVTLLFSGFAFADTAKEIEKLSKQYGCSGCHAVNEVKAGPPYRIIAKEYKGKPNVKETLVKSILGGSMMKWQAKAKKYKIKIKMAYMPAQHGVKKEQAEKIVDLILKLDTK